MCEYGMRIARGPRLSLIVPTPREKAELLRLGTLLDHDAADVMHVVQPETYWGWVRQSRRSIFAGDPGEFLEQRHSS